MSTEWRSSRRGRPVYAPTKGAALVGDSVNAQGNEIALRKEEPGRIREGKGEAGRPRARATARFVSGVNPLESITGPYLPRA